VVKIIETIFPDSIDKLNEEVSEKTGDKPCLIEPCNADLLCEFFFGKSIKDTTALPEFNYDDDEPAQANAGPAAPEEERKSMTPQFGAS